MITLPKAVCFFGCLLTTGLIVLNLTACNNTAPQTPSPPPGLRPAPRNKVLKVVWRTTQTAMAIVETANGVYQIYVDCQKGLVAPQNRSPFSSTENANLVQDICQSLANSSISSPTSPSNMLDKYVTVLEFSSSGDITHNRIPCIVYCGSKYHRTDRLLANSPNGDSLGWSFNRLRTCGCPQN